MLWVYQQCAIGVGVGVYEARRDDMAGGVDDAAGFGLRQVADCLYGLAVDTDVGAVSRRLRSVDDGTSDYNHVKHGSSLS